jgi:hypothetical protein
MSITETIAYKCTCERCSHRWTSIASPLTCSKCRSPYWNVARGGTPVEKKSAEAAPVLDKKTEIDDLRHLLTPVEKSPSILPVWPVKAENQPDPYSEPTTNWD